MTSWKTPLPNVRVPDDLRALAVLQRAGDDLRRRRGVAVDEHDQRRRLGAIGVAGGVRASAAATPRPRVDTIVPSVRNALATSCASLTRPPPLRAQVEHDARARPACRRRLMRVVDLARARRS